MTKTHTLASHLCKSELFVVIFCRELAWRAIDWRRLHCLFQGRRAPVKSVICLVMSCYTEEAFEVLPQTDPFAYYASITVQQARYDLPHRSDGREERGERRGER